MRLSKPFTLFGILRRNSGYIFMFCVVFIFMQVGFHSGRRYHAQLDDSMVEESPRDPWSPKNILPSFVSNDKNVIREHPIPRLMEEAEEKYRRKLGSQSKTLKDAVIEYKRRYRRPPPKGFDAWWDFAQKYQVKMIDEYDGMIDDLKPFWALSGEEIRRRSFQAGHLPSIDLVRIRDGNATIEIVNPEFKDTEISARARGFRSMLGKFMKTVCYFLKFLATHSNNFFCPAPRYGLCDQYESRRKSARPLGTSNVSKSYDAGLFRYVQVVLFVQFSNNVILCSWR